MRKRGLLALGLWLLALGAPGWLVAKPAAAAPASAGREIRGRVLNGTTHRPLPGIPVAFFGQGDAEGSSPLITVKSGANGQFAVPALAGPGAMIARATYRGVQYWQPVTDAAKPLDLTVYDLAPPRAKFQLAALVAVVQPEHGQLAVVDEYVIHNPLKRTLYRRGGIFRFRLPRNVQPDGARVIGPSGVGLNRNVQPSGDAGIYTVDYPLEPGETRVQVSYRLPYATQTAHLTEQAVYPTHHMLVYVPQPMKFQGAKFAPLTTSEGYQVYGALATLQPLEFTVSGTAPLPTAMQGGSADGGGAAGSGQAAGAAAANGGDNGQAAADAAAAQPGSAMAGIVPPKGWMQENGYGVLIVLVILAATCFAYLATRPKAAMAGMVAPQAAGPAVEAAAASAGAAPEGPPGRIAPGQPGGAAEAQPRAEVRGIPAPAGSTGLATDLARLKDELFLLEVRRQTGDIDEAAYSQARASLDARLRELRLR